MIFADIEAWVKWLAAFAIIGGKFKRFDADTCDLHWELADSTPMVSGFPNIALFKPDEEEKVRIERFLRLASFSRTRVLQKVGLASEAIYIEHTAFTHCLTNNWLIIKRKYSLLIFIILLKKP